jgi:hypothetical protein
MHKQGPESRQSRTLMGRRSGLSSKRHAVVDINGLPMRLALTTGKALDSCLVLALLACWPALKSGAMLLVDLWIVVMTLSGSERSTARTAQLTGKNPTEPKPGESGAQRRSQSSRAVLSTRMSNIAVSQSLLQANYLAVIQLAGHLAKVTD